MIDVLQREYNERCSRNPNYSLRAFARFLMLSPSTVSELLQKKRKLSIKLRDKLAKGLGIPEDKIKDFKATDHGNRRATTTSVDDAEFGLLSPDTFAVISEWYHFAIRQLMQTQDFQSDPVWIAHRLNITLQEVNQALERMLRLKLIKQNAKGNYEIGETGTTHLRPNFTNEDLKRFQVLALERAIKSIKIDSLDVRDNTTMIFAMPKSAIPLAKEEIKKFRRGLTKKLESFQNKDEVYQLAISLTPLSNFDNES